MKKRLLINLLTLLPCTMMSGQELQKVLQSTKFGGYVIGKYSTSDMDDATNSSFDLRLGRVYADGKINDFSYKLQIEVTGSPKNATTNSEKTVRIVDAWAEWGKYCFAKVRFGQFKRCFTFENPYNPWDVGFAGNAQVITKLSGFSDRVGEHSSNGRDVGLQVQGDILQTKNVKGLLHYQIGVYNGQGINKSDVNNNKDLIGGLWINPVKNLSVGAFGWTGKYESNGICVDRNRMAYGIKYEDKWTFRAEYISSEGHKISDYDSNGMLKSNTSDKTDGWYTAIGIPINTKFKVYAKWDVYRDDKTSTTQKTTYNISGNYYLNKNLKFQLNYSYTDDNNISVADAHYNTIDAQLYWRF